MTPANLILSSRGHSALDSGGDVMVKTNAKLVANAAENLTALAHSGGLGLRVSSGPLKFQAQSTNIDAASRNDARLTSSQAKVAVEGSKAVTGTSGGGYITLKDGNIELGCPGEITFKCAAWVRQGPNEIKPELPFFMPLTAGSFDEQFVFLDPDGNPIADVAYKITIEDGTVYRGRTDHEGRTRRIFTEESQKIKFETDIS